VLDALVGVAGQAVIGTESGREERLAGEEAGLGEVLVVVDVVERGEGVPVGRGAATAEEGGQQGEDQGLQRGEQTQFSRQGLGALGRALGRRGGGEMRHPVNVAHQC
jgi:hypothetical protein